MYSTHPIAIIVIIFCLTILISLTFTFSIKSSWLFLLLILIILGGLLILFIYIARIASNYKIINYEVIFILPLIFILSFNSSSWLKINIINNKFSAVFIPDFILNSIFLILYLLLSLYLILKLINKFNNSLFLN